MRGGAVFKRFAIGLAGAAALAGAAPAAAGSLLDYVGQCVPFARAASGIEIYGDAWTWWDQADGKYPRGHIPRIGAVIAFAKQSRLPLGHVAVVSRIVEKRVLMLTHAHWSRVNGARGPAEPDVTLSDVKVWYRDSDGLGGSIYDVNGFIYAPGRPSPELTARNPDYVGALIDAYVPGAGAR